LGNVLVARSRVQGSSAESRVLLDSYTDLLLKRADVNSSGTSDAADMTALYSSFGQTTWLTDLTWTASG